MPLKLSRAGFFGNSNRNYGRGNFTPTSSSDIITSRPEQENKTNNIASLNAAGRNNTTVPLKPSQIIPLKRRSLSMEVNPHLSSKNINIGATRLGKENSLYPKSVWYKSIFGRLNQTLKWNTSSISEKRSKSLKVSKAVSTSDRDIEQPPSLIEKDNPLDTTSQSDTTLIPSTPLPTGVPTAPASQAINSRNSSFFEICAQTPRHNTSEAEVLGKVGRFTIVRERKDFNTTIFDQCHCTVKPCPYAESATHPPAEAVVLSNYSSRSVHRNSSSRSLPITIQPINSLSHNQRYPPNQKPSISVMSTNGPSQRHSMHTTNFYNTTQAATIPSQPLAIEQQHGKDSTIFNKSISAPVASVPNITTTVPSTKSVYQEKPCHSASDSPSATKNETNSDVETNNTVVINSTTTASIQNAKPSRFVVHKLSNGSLNSDNSNTPTAQLTPTLSSHATINSHSGRKFEVEWLTDLTKVSPSSTISSIISYATSISAPSSNSFTPSSSLSSQQGGSLSKSSTLSSKSGRKFEVTVSERDTAVANYDA